MINQNKLNLLALILGYHPRFDHILWFLNRALFIYLFNLLKPEVTDNRQRRGKSLPKKRRDLKDYKSFLFLKELWRFIEIHSDFYQDLLRFLLTHSEFFLKVFLKFTKSLLEHSYQIALIFQHGKEVDKNLYICEDSRDLQRFKRFTKIYWDLQRFIRIYKDLLGFVKIYEIYRFIRKCTRFIEWFAPRR